MSTTQNKAKEVVLTKEQFASRQSGGTLSENNSYQIIGQAVPQYETMPTASATYLGEVAQFIGTTGNGYIHNHFYECTRSGTEGSYVYAWTIANIGISGTHIGANWTTLTINGDNYNIPSGTTSVSGTKTGDNWATITINGTTGNIPDDVPNYTSALDGYVLKIEAISDSIAHIVWAELPSNNLYEHNVKISGTDSEGREIYIYLRLYSKTQSTGFSTLEDLALYLIGTTEGYYTFECSGNCNDQSLQIYTPITSLKLSLIEQVTSWSFETPIEAQALMEYPIDSSFTVEDEVMTR